MLGRLLRIALRFDGFDGAGIVLLQVVGDDIGSRVGRARSAGNCMLMVPMGGSA